MNHGAKSVVGHVVQGNKSRAGYFFSQPINGVELLLQRQTYISQDMEAAEVQSAEEEILLNLPLACVV